MTKIVQASAKKVYFQFAECRQFSANIVFSPLIPILHRWIFVSVVCVSMSKSDGDCGAASAAARNRMMIAYSATGRALQPVGRPTSLSGNTND